MLLSACLIIRNEAARLPQCLEQLRPLADEIIVVDTGSIDNSVALAQELGARIIQSPWENHYGAVRNTGLEAAQGQWILSVDADEWVDPASHSALKAFLPQAPEAIYSLRWRQDPQQAWSRKAVLLPNHPDIRYIGRVHEIPCCPSRPMAYQALEMVLEHNPTASPLGSQKLEAYRRLLMMDLDHSDPIPRFHAQRHWAQSFVIMGQDAQAESEFLQAWSLFAQLPETLKSWGSPVLEGLLFLAVQNRNQAAYHYWRQIYAQHYPESTLLAQLPEALPQQRQAR